jgi:hypothetical protein
MVKMGHSSCSQLMISLPVCLDAAACKLQLRSGTCPPVNDLTSSLSRCCGMQVTAEIWNVSSNLIKILVLV